MTNTPLIILTTFEKFFFYSYYLLSCILYIIFSLVTIALFTVVERKIMAALQKRKGPNVHGIGGSLQAFADGLKLLLKEDFVPSTANAFLFRAAPIYTFFIALSSGAVLPFSISQSYFFSNLGILYIFALSSLGVYGIILSGGASNSKYSFLGSLRSAAQMISYEVSLGFIIITLCMLCGSLSLNKFVLDQLFFGFIIPFFPLFFIFFISIVAETNRAPFDLPEAEAELVSGYNVEYGGISFALFFLAEYSNIILMSTLLVLLFLGGGGPLFGIPFFSVLDTAFNFYFIFGLSFKVQIILGIFVGLRVSFPRYRYDQLMFLGGNVLLPFSLSLFFSYSIFLFYYDCLPAYHFYMHPNYIYYCNDTPLERSFYFWDRFHEFDQADNTKENVALSDINNYKDEIKKKVYFFERSYGQKLYFIDIPYKYINYFEFSKKRIMQDFLELSNFNTLNLQGLKTPYSQNPAALLYNLSLDSNFSCSKRQCFVFFIDPNFSVSDVYVRYFNSLKFENYEMNAEFLLSRMLLQNCHNDGQFLNSIIFNYLKINNLEIYQNNEVSKSLFYMYSLKNKLGHEIEELRQSCLSLQIIMEKYRPLQNISLSDKALVLERQLLLISGEDDLLVEQDAELFNILGSNPKNSMFTDILEKDELRFVKKNKQNFEALKEKIEALNNAFLKDKQIVDVLNRKHYSLGGTGKVEVTIKKNI